jgi:hypothetical protein
MAEMDMGDHFHCPFCNLRETKIRRTGRPRKHASNAEKQAAYRNRSEGTAINAAWTKAAMRQQIAQLHVVLHFAVIKMPELAECIGANERDTLEKTTEFYRKKTLAMGGNHLMKVLNG